MMLWRFGWALPGSLAGILTHPGRGQVGNMSATSGWSEWGLCHASVAPISKNIWDVVCIPTEAKQVSPERTSWVPKREMGVVHTPNTKPIICSINFRTPNTKPISIFYNLHTPTTRPIMFFEELIRLTEN